jgi:hypothetical protein
MMTLRMKYLADSLQPLPKICFDYLCHISANQENNPEDDHFFKIGKKILEEQDNMDKVHENAPYHPPPDGMEESPYKEYDSATFPENWEDKYRIQLKTPVQSATSIIFQTTTKNTTVKSTTSIYHPPHSSKTTKPLSVNIL